MYRLTLSFLAGALAVTVAVFAAGGRASVVSFLIGFAFAIAAAVLSLSSAKRIKHTARFLTALADALETTKTPGRKAAVVAIAPSAMEVDLTSALQNMGVKKAQASAAARAAIAADPAGTFEQLFMLATRKAA